MNTVLPLEKMTIEQKLRLLEELTIDLFKYERGVATGSSQKDPDEERQHRVEEGHARSFEGETVKRDVGDKTAQDRLLAQMSVEEKRRAKDEISEDLRRNEDQIPVPNWHLEILREREREIAEGKAEFVDIEEFKRLVAAEIARGRPK